MGFSTLLWLIGSDTNPMFSLPPWWHLVVGGYAFGLVFMATDPVSASMTEVRQVDLRNPDRCGHDPDPGHQPGVSRRYHVGHFAGQRVRPDDRLFRGAGKCEEEAGSPCSVNR